MLLLFHLLLAGILFFITNWVGKHSYSFGYSTIHLTSGDGHALVYNLLFRVFSPIVFITVLSALFYFARLDFLTVDIYRVAIFYFVIRVLVIFIVDRVNMVNWPRLILTGCIYMWLSYQIYITYLKEKKTLLPDFNSMVNEFWVFIVVYLYFALNDISLDNSGFERRRFRYFSQKIPRFRSRFDVFFRNDQFDDIALLTYTIMVIEDFNRPLVTRTLEYAKHSVDKKEHTFGIMQVRSAIPLSDEESVVKAICIIENELNKAKLKIQLGQEKYYSFYSLCYSLGEVYNGSSSYGHDICELSLVVEKFLPPNCSSEALESRLKQLVPSQVSPSTP